MCRIGSDKTLCEILTVTGAMPLPIAGPRVDCNLSGTVPCGRPFNEATVELGAGHLVSWIWHMIEKLSTNADRSSHYHTIAR